MSGHVSRCILTANEIPAFVGDVTRFSTRPLVSNQFRDALVHGVHVKLYVFSVLRVDLREAGV